MDIGIVSMRYAKALMEYAKSMGTEDTLYKEFCMLDRSFRKHPDLRMALENPILTIREKFALICTAVVGDAPAGCEFARFMTLVLKNRRESFLHSSGTDKCELLTYRQHGVFPCHAQIRMFPKATVEHTKLLVPSIFCPHALGIFHQCFRITHRNDSYIPVSYTHLL